MCMELPDVFATFPDGSVRCSRGLVTDPERRDGSNSARRDSVLVECPNLRPPKCRPVWAGGSAAFNRWPLYSGFSRSEGARRTECGYPAASLAIKDRGFL